MDKVKKINKKYRQGRISKKEMREARHSLRDLRNLGKEIWRDVDVDAYASQLRDEWDR